MFYEVFPIVNPIVNGIGWRYPKLRAINYFFGEIGSLHIDTAENHLEKSQTGESWKMGHPTLHIQTLKVCYKNKKEKTKENMFQLS